MMMILGLVKSQQCDCPQCSQNNTVTGNTMSTWKYGPCPVGYPYMCINRLSLSSTVPRGAPYPMQMCTSDISPTSYCMVPSSGATTCWSYGMRVCYALNYLYIGLACQSLSSCTAFNARNVTCATSLDLSSLDLLEVEMKPSETVIVSSFK